MLLLLLVAVVLCKDPVTFSVYTVNVTHYFEGHKVDERFFMDVEKTKGVALELSDAYNMGVYCITDTTWMDFKQGSQEQCVQESTITFEEIELMGHITKAVVKYEGIEGCPTRTDKCDTWSLSGGDLDDCFYFAEEGKGEPVAVMDKNKKPVFLFHGFASGKGCFDESKAFVLPSACH